jgi:hypothetical protein
MREIAALFLGLTVLAHATLAWADNEGALQQVGYGAASVLGTLVYAPLKAALCIMGGLSSAPVRIFDRETAAGMVGASCGGTWVITPAVVKGREPLEFVGRAS